MPNRSHQCLSGGEATLRTRHIKFRPSFIQEAEVELTRDLSADRMLHLREVQHHAMGIQVARHRNDQLIVVTMTWRETTGTKARSIVVC